MINLPRGYTALDLKSLMITLKGNSIYIPRMLKNYHRKNYTIISFTDRTTRDVAIETSELTLDDKYILKIINSASSLFLHVTNLTTKSVIVQIGMNHITIINISISNLNIFICSSRIHVYLIEVKNPHNLDLIQKLTKVFYLMI